MKVDGRNFVLALRAIGIFFVFVSLPGVVYFVSTFVIGLYLLLFGTADFGAYIKGPKSLGEWVLSTAPSLFYELFRFFLGLYLLKGGGRLAAWCLKSVQPLCPGCARDLREENGLRCSHCGTENPFYKPSANSGMSQT